MNDAGDSDDADGAGEAATQWQTVKGERLASDRAPRRFIARSKLESWPLLRGAGGRETTVPVSIGVQ